MIRFGLGVEGCCSEIKHAAGAPPCNAVIQATSQHTIMSMNQTFKVISMIFWSPILQVVPCLLGSCCLRTPTQPALHCHQVLTLLQAPRIRPTSAIVFQDPSYSKQCVKTGLQRH